MAASTDKKFPLSVFDARDSSFRLELPFNFDGVSPSSVRKCLIFPTNRRIYWAFLLDLPVTDKGSGMYVLSEAVALQKSANKKPLILSDFSVFNINTYAETINDLISEYYYHDENNIGSQQLLLTTKPAGTNVSVKLLTLDSKAQFKTVATL
ncbi:MAG: hypothetical protein RPU34_13540 [Candidatus Sedimenticola sp. (ex Thyasira tokunagai)]